MDLAAVESELISLQLDSQAPDEIAMREHAEPCDRAPEALLAGLVEIEARLEGQALETGAYRFALYLERSRRKSKGLHWSRAVVLNGADDRSIAVDLAQPARAFGATEGEHLAGHKALSLVGVHGLSQSRSGCQEGSN